MTDAPALCVVVPAHQAEGEIGACIDAILAAGFAAGEVTVVDDGSRDATGEIARARGVRVLRNEAPLRPARARNAGVAATGAELIVFVDADVLIAPGARARIISFFADRPDHVALFGSYDAAPRAPRPVSRYRNLLHHWVHQTNDPEAQTFWTGFGAVRRAAYLAAGGLDPRWEDIEDVELGLRMTAAGGRIRLDRDLLCKHLKDWTLASMMRTDRLGRAVPWTRLMAAGRMRGGDLNTTLPRQVSAACVAGLAPAILLSLAWPPALWLAAALATGFTLVNLRFLMFLARVGGPLFALRSLGYHALHTLAALAGWIQARLGLFRARSPAP